jgi:hypothetical protein
MFTFFYGINKQEKQQIEGNFIYCCRFSVIFVLSGHFEPSNSRQKFKIWCSHFCKISRPTSIFHAKVSKQSWHRKSFKQVLYPHLRLRFFLLASLLITINAALQIIKSTSELDIVVKNYSCNRANVSEKNFGLNIVCLSTLFTNTVQKHRSRTVFNQFCSQTSFANIVCQLYRPTVPALRYTLHENLWNSNCK